MADSNIHHLDVPLLRSQREKSGDPDSLAPLLRLLDQAQKGSAALHDRLGVFAKDSFVHKVMIDTDAGIDMHGEYLFYDKGPREVIDTGKWVEILKCMAPEEAGRNLEELANQKRGDEDPGCHSVYYVVATSLLSDLDGQPEEWWERCCGYCPSVMY